MQQSSARNILRLFVLAIGFALFVVVSVRSAATASSQQAVRGKPYMVQGSLTVTQAEPVDITVQPTQAQAQLDAVQPIRQDAADPEAEEVVTADVSTTNEASKPEKDTEHHVAKPDRQVTVQPEEK